ncbi:MAG: GNAT family N-acetyltransferase [Pseudomonadota bacterium]
MSFTIRPAQSDDAASVCNVLRRSIAECCSLDHGGESSMLAAWLGNKTSDNVAAWIGTPTNHTVVAERDGVVAGVALVNQAGKLSLCYVLPEAQGVGLGKALLLAVEEQARSWGVSVVRLHGTATAQGFFARHGYIFAGKEKSCYGLECDLFWKKLDAEQSSQGAKFCNCNAR